MYLIDSAETNRDKAVSALFVESGLRVAELANIKFQNIDWQNRTIKIPASVERRLTLHLVSCQNSI